MKFILDLWPDVPDDTRAQDLLAFAVDSIRNNPELSWTITDDRGEIIDDDVRLDAPRKPLIEIIHGRDPDSSCEHTVFLDGGVTHDYEIVDLDPGRGWEREDWEEFKESALAGGSPAFRAALEAEFESHDNSQYIED